MEYSSILDEIVEQLERDPSLTRIKKIMFCACHGRWENDIRKIEELDLRDLISELWEKNPRLEEVDSLLSHIVSKVNKKTEYGLVARKIIENVGKLYLTDQEATIMETTISSFWDYPVDTELEGSLNDGQEEDIFNAREPGDLFDVRQQIMQSANPLKVKILIFSAVERQFNFSDRDWLNLKTRLLDDLLRQMFNVCITITDLESQLYSAANTLEDPDENTQIASVIIEYMKPCYDNLSVSAEYEVYAPDDNNGELVAVAEEVQLTQDDYGEKTQQYVADKSNLVASEITLLSQQEKSTNSSYQFEIYDPSLDFTNSAIGAEITGNDEVEDFDDEVDETMAFAPPIEPVPLPEKQIIEESREDSLAEEAISSINILDSIKQKLGLEEEVTASIDRSVNAVMMKMEEEFRWLENTLDRALAGADEEERLSMKYQSLGKLIVNVKEMSGKFQEILNQLEQEERKKHGGISSKDFSETDIENSEASAGTRQKALDLAKKGNPKAIALIMNQYLQAKGINAIAGWRDDCLHVILESEPIPNQQSIAPFVEKKILALKADSLKNVKIHGRQSGTKSIAWTHQLES